MIMARNEDGTYSQVGFVKDNAGIDTEYIYDKDGDIVFEKGFTRETSGTVPLTINGIGKDLKAWSITGNTLQNGTPTPDNPVEVQAVGDRTANLFDKNDCTVAGYIKNDGTISITADNWFTTKNYIKCSGIITMNALNGLGNAAHIACYDEQKNLLGACRITENNQNQNTINLIDGTKYIKACSRDNNLDSLMLNTGSTPLPYEPYGYKIPIVTRGKNLFKAPMYTSKTENGVTWESNGDGTITVSGIASGYSSFMLSNAYPIPSNCIGQKLTFNYRIGKVSNIVWDSITFFDENNTEVGRYAVGNSDTLTIEIESNFKKVDAYVKRNNNYEVSGTVGLMIELGTEATPYEPYYEPITTPIYLDSPLYKIGDYADRIGSKEEVRVVKEMVLTGQENWTTYSGFSAQNCYQFNTNITNHNVNSEAISTHFVYTSVLRTLIDNDGTFMFDSNKYIRVHISSCTTLDDFKSYLADQYAAGTPVKVYYVLAAPETTAIEPIEIPTLNGTTVIDVDTTVKPTEMYTKYKSSK